ncbi:MAG: M1 family metallopeptidase [Melioribacteraceae bacterium]|nr:M1 family metallopeptidase [Melioribacteraceae bacterium]
MQRIIFLILLLSTANIFSQNSNLFIPLDVIEAYENGTRTYDGTVSSSYWINHTDYKIDVEFFPDSNYIVGSAKIIYFNESPDSLSKIVLRLYQNIVKPGVAKDWNISAKLLGDGMKIKSLIVRGDSVKVNSEHAKIGGTNMSIRLDKKLSPNDKIDLEIEWSFELPKFPLRMGNYNGDFFIAYWYPQVAVYDDVYGWDMLQYSGVVECYNDFNNYDINYTVPADYVLWSTGELQNGENVFSNEILERLQRAKNSDETVNIITVDDYEKNNVTLKTASGKNTWSFRASKVPDIAWAVSNNYNWDASSIEVEPGRRVLTAAIYPDSIKQYKNAALYARESIKYMSEVSPGVPYPWSHTTAFTNKGKRGGMEFPMMQNNSAPKKISRNLGLIFHEIVHNYFPFYMGTNERREAWMDEGWAAYFPQKIVEKYDSTSRYGEYRVSSYEKMAGKTKDVPMILPSYMMTHGESRTNFYNRPAVAYMELRQLLGDELFNKALREYMNRWHEKHPIGYDFFFTFNDVAGEDLSWFWKPWFFDLGYPDLAIENVEVKNSVATILLSKVGNIPTRIELTVLFDDGESEVIQKSASLWKESNEAEIKLKSDKKIKSVKLGSPLIPDVNKDNNLFEMK